MKAILTTVAVLLSFIQFSHSQNYKVGILFDQFASPRWKIDSMHLKQSMEALDIAADIRVAHSQLEVQKKQARAMIANDVDALIIIAVDGENMSDIVSEAKAKDIVVVAYARPIIDSEIDFFIGYDNAEIGRRQAQSVLKNIDGGNIILVNGPTTDYNAIVFRENQLKILQPYIDAGQVKIVYDIILDSWNEMSVLLKLYDLNPNLQDIDAIIAATDNCVSALTEYASNDELLKKIYITGQDPSEKTISRMETGIQNMTAFKPIQPLGKKTASIVQALLSGQPTGKFTNLTIQGVKFNAYLFSPTIIDQDNIDVFKVLIK